MSRLINRAVALSVGLIVFLLVAQWLHGRVRSPARPPVVAVWTWDKRSPTERWVLVAPGDRIVGQAFGVPMDYAACYSTGQCGPSYTTIAAAIADVERWAARHERVTAADWRTIAEDTTGTTTGTFGR